MNLLKKFLLNIFLFFGFELKIKKKDVKSNNFNSIIKFLLKIGKEKSDVSKNIFFDVGANIGVYSLTVANSIHNITIDAFEPHQGAFKRMMMNVKQNNSSNIIKCYNLALSNENNEGYLLASSRFGEYQSGGAKLSSYGKMKIKQVCGDNILKDVNKTIAIKVDVEGLELLVLQGLVNLIKNNRIFLQIEIFDKEFVKTSNFLEKYNFKLIEKGTFTHQDTVKDYFYTNF